MEYCKELHIWVVINFEGNFPAHFLFLAVIKLFVGLVPFDCVRVAAFLSPVLIWISCLLLLGFWLLLDVGWVVNRIKEAA